MKVPVQPSVNIGTVGQVDHGKTAIVKLLTGESTDRHSEEIKRGISIRLGYADSAFYKCPKDEPPKGYSTNEVCKYDGTKTELLRAVSFVDSPGHETLMATMVSGAAIMDGALLVIAANEDVPQPQTKEHLMALSIIGVDKVIIVQNKIDIVTEEQAKENLRQIREFVKGSIAEKAPVIPMSAHHEVNVDMLIQTIEEVIPSRKYDETKPARMFIARPFDVNQPGSPPDKLVGGDDGGTLNPGKLRDRDDNAIRPRSEEKTRSTVGRGASTT